LQEIRKSHESVTGYPRGSLPNDSHEAYTGNSVGRRGQRTSPKQFSPESEVIAVDDVFNDTEVYTVMFDTGKNITGQSGSKSVAC